MSRPASKLMQPTPPSQQPNQFLPRSTTFAGMPEGGSSSDERGVLLELQMELNNLRRQLDATEKTNAHKMDEAAQHIGILEEELHRRDENDRIMQEEIMKNMWEQQLNGMIVELEACQRNIQDLQARLEEKENQAVYHESHSVKDILEKQKQEIARLSGLLDRFSGLPVSADPGRQIPAAVEPPSREDLLRRNFQHALYPAASQRFSNRPASAIGVTAQFPPYLHPVPPSPVFPNSRGPIHVDGLLQHSMSNPVLSNPHSYRHTPASVLQCEAAPTGGLYCNVPEHHHLEDYLQTLHQKNQTLKEKMNQRKIAEHDEEVRVLRKIRREIEVKHEELDEVNVEMERKQISIERLLTREKELLQSAEELQRQLMLLRQKSNEVATETFEKETRLQAERDLLQLKQMSERQSYLQTEVHCLEETIAMRKLELSSVESRLTGAKDNLDKVKVEMQNSKSCLEETEANYTRTILECEELEKRAREASYELVRANSDLMELRRKVGTLSAEKQKLELALEDVKRVLVKKDEDFQRLCRQLTINQSNLHSLQDTLLVASEEEKEKLTYIQEADKILAERKQELERLKDQIHQEEIRLEKLDETVGERKAQLHLTETQFHRRQEEQQRFCRELEQEIRIRTQDVEEIRASIDSLQEKREQLDKTIDQMLKEKSRLKQELQSERENFRILIRQVQEKEAEKEQLSHSILLEQANLNNLKTQCHEKSTLLEHVNESLTEKQKSIEEFQAICKRKKTDLDTTRDLAAREKQELDSLEEIKQTLRCSIKQLKEEKEILFEQKCQLDNNVAAARREISRLEDQINYSKNRLEVLQSDCLSAQQNAEDIRRDKDRLNVEIRELEVKLQSSRSQLAMEKGRLDSSNEDYDRLSKKIAEKQSLRDQLTQEVDNLMRQCRGHKTQCEELKKNMAELQDQRDQLCLQLSDSQVELRDITQSIADLKCNHRMEEEKSHKMMQDNQRDLKNLDEAVSKKEMMLKELSVKLREIQVKMIEEDRTDKKIDQLLQMLQEKTEELESHQEDKQHLTESLEHSYAELLVLRNQLAHERDSKETLSHKFATELQAARRELQEQERSHRHNLKCCREEMKQLQMTAEEQCNRANRLSEELNQSRHDYILLRRQAEIFASVLEDSSTAFINQQDVLQREKYMEQTMKAVKADVEMDRVRAKLFAQSTPETEDSGIAGNGIPHRHHAFSDGLSSPLFSRQENDAYKKLQRIRLSNNNDLEESHSRLERETRQFQEDLLNRLPSSHLNSTFKPTYTSIYTRSSDVTAQPSGVALDENKWPTPDKGTSSSGTASKTNGHSSSITVQRISAANFNASGTLQLPGGEHALSDCSSAHSTPPPLPLLMSTSPEKGVCA